MNTINLYALLLNLFSQYDQKIERMLVDRRSLDESASWNFLKNYPEFRPVLRRGAYEYADWENGLDELWPKGLILWTTDWVVYADYEELSEYCDCETEEDLKCFELKFVPRHPMSDLPPRTAELVSYAQSWK